MGNPKNNTQELDVFTIDLADSGEIPGITKLLHRQKEAEKNAATHATHGTPTSTLTSLGVHYEIQFQAIENEFRFSKLVCHKDPAPDLKTETWRRELLKGMVFSVDFFLNQNNFEEYEGETLVGQAVGAEAHEFVQVFRFSGPMYTILISGVSLKKSYSELCTLLKPKNQDASAVIELDLTG